MESVGILEFACVKMATLVRTALKVSLLTEPFVKNRGMTGSLW